MAFPRKPVPLKPTNEFQDIENLCRLEIAMGVSINVGDEVHFFTDPERSQVLGTFTKPLNKKNYLLWVSCREHIEWGKIEAISFDQRYYIGPEIQVHGLWFPLALIELINGEEINYGAIESRG